MARKRVKVGRDHVQRLIGTSPQKAIEELIWNALDAGGDRVEVKLRFNEMSSVDRVEVSDRGPGIQPAELDRAFGNIGNSIKAQQQTNADGRAYHGREGKGRFKALALSPVAVWETTVRDNGTMRKYRITLRRDEPDYFDATDAADSKAKSTGTRVILDELDKGHQSLGRAHLVAAQVEGTNAYKKAWARIDLAVDGLRDAGTLDHLPRGLHARAELYLLTGDHAEARAALNEAMDIATRDPAGHMKLHVTDCHLGYARLALAEKKTEVAGRELAKARALIEETGYHRRDADVAELENGVEGSGDPGA